MLTWLRCRTGCLDVTWSGQVRSAPCSASCSALCFALCSLFCSLLFALLYYLLSALDSCIGSTWRMTQCPHQQIWDGDFKLTCENKWWAGETEEDTAIMRMTTSWFPDCDQHRPPHQPSWSESFIIRILTSSYQVSILSDLSHNTFGDLLEKQSFSKCWKPSPLVQDLILGKDQSCRQFALNKDSCA